MRPYSLKKKNHFKVKKAAWTTWQCLTKGLQGTTLLLSSSWRTIIMKDLVFPFIWKAGRWFHPLVYPRPVIKPQEIEGEGNFQCCLLQKRLYICIIWKNWFQVKSWILMMVILNIYFLVCTTKPAFMYPSFLKFSKCNYFLFSSSFMDFNLKKKRVTIT